jgi:hypothetical protein
LRVRHPGKGTGGGEKVDGFFWGGEWRGKCVMERSAPGLDHMGLLG